ncbi:MAG: ABC transporter permease [Rhodothermaceae bacterium]
MNSINTMCKAFICELKKSKKSSAFWLSFLGTVSIAGIFFIMRVWKYEHFVPKEGVNPWDKFIFENFWSVGNFFLPFYVILLTALIVQLEHRTNMWKHLKVLPFHFSAIFYSKLMLIVTYIVGTHIFYTALMIGAGYLSGIIHPELKYMEFSPDFNAVITNMGLLIVSSFGMLAVQYWASMRTKSFVVPIGIGMVANIACMILVSRWEDIIYFPYAYASLTSFAERKMVKFDTIMGIRNINVFSILYFAGISLLAYFDIKRIEVK